MKLLLVAVGKVRTPYLREGCNDYLRRIRKLTPIEIRELKAGKGTNPVAAKSAETERIIAAIGETGYKIAALSDGGEVSTSKKFAKLIEKVENSGSSGLAFIIGGAWGLSDEVIDKADFLLSMGPMTMSHELARLVLIEQIYRAEATLRGVPYPK